MRGIFKISDLDSADRDLAFMIFPVNQNIVGFHVYAEWAAFQDLDGKGELTRMDNILIVKLGEPTQSVFENPFRCVDGQVFLSKAQKMVFEVVEYKHWLFGNGVLGETDVLSTIAEPVVYVFEVMIILLGGCISV